MSQIQFSGSCSQDSGSHCRKSQVPGTQFQGLGCQTPTFQGPVSRVRGVRVSFPRVPEPQSSGSQVLWLRVPCPESHISGFRGPRVQGLRVSGPYFRLSPKKIIWCIYMQCLFIARQLKLFRSSNVPYIFFIGTQRKMHIACNISKNYNKNTPNLKLSHAPML